MVQDVKNWSDLGYCNHEKEELKILREDSKTNCERKPKLESKS